jgi:hypothetical protein
MILLSGITDSAVGVVLAILFALTLLTYGLLYWILSRVESIRDLFKRLKETKPALFYLSHVLLYFLSIFVLYGALSLRYYLTNEGILRMIPHSSYH